MHPKWTEPGSGLGPAALTKQAKRGGTFIGLYTAKQAYLEAGEKTRA